MGLFDRFRQGEDDTAGERPAAVADWTPADLYEGDHRRLAAAFEALDRNGIHARMDFSCCPTSPAAEMEDEKVDGSRGYVSFGPVAAGDRQRQEAAFAAVVATTERIGAEVAEALRREGLTVDGDGTGVRRIQVSGLDWRKRLPVG